MENINNIITPEIPVQPIETSVTPEPQLPPLLPQPETQNILSTDNINPKKTNGGIKKYLFFIFLILILALIAILFLKNNSRFDKTTSLDQASKLTSINEETLPPIEISPTKSLIKTKFMTDTSKGNSLEQLDEKWSIYTNRTWGFSIKLPNRVEISDSLYGDLIVDDRDDTKVVITSTFNGTISLKKDTQIIRAPKWEIMLKSVSDDKEINSIINNKIYYGQTGCEIGEKKQLADNSYQIVVKETEKEKLIEYQNNPDKIDYNTLCVGNEFYFNFIRYFPNKQILIYWEVDQKYKFFKSIEPLESYDQEMMDSFSFINQ